MGGAQASAGWKMRQHCRLSLRLGGPNYSAQMSVDGMSESKQTQDLARRKARLSAALRANLKRRKMQVHGRAASAERPKGTAPPGHKSNQENP